MRRAGRLRSWRGKGEGTDQARRLLSIPGQLSFVTLPDLPGTMRPQAIKQQDLLSTFKNAVLQTL
ncbi:hypothetical protein DYI23_05400 [Roseibium polysiphoniae]|uniref:Uncharacterized protein n=1 Tax=Roseibium polysiphoniae TaxID=2571221 RepID=A0A944CB34_9HYPH|nr:hypothetical protein [Roseibium polysiphoniae]